MSIDLSAIYTITAPSATDGYGEIAVLNDSTSANFVGYLYDLSFGREVRENADNKAEANGGVHGSFYSGRLPFTMEIQIARAATWALSNARADKLSAALDAHVSDGSVVWTESGRVATRILFRQQQSPRGPDKEGKVLFAGVSADSLILANTLSSSAPGSGLTNAGKHATLPSFAFTTAASGSVVISRTSPSPTETMTLTIGGTGLAASTATVVDFAARTVYQGSTNKRGSIVWPASIWWGMAPTSPSNPTGANTISVTGATSITVTWRSAWLP